MLSIPPIIPFNSLRSTSQFLSAALAWGEIEAQSCRALWNWGVAASVWKQIIIFLEWESWPELHCAAVGEGVGLFPLWSMNSYRAGDCQESGEVNENYYVVFLLLMLILFLFFNSQHYSSLPLFCHCFLLFVFNRGLNSWTGWNTN